jgi:hypothetical protein
MKTKLSHLVIPGSRFARPGMTSFATLLSSLNPSDTP